MTHQYIERATNRVQTERLYWDGVVRFLYGSVRESAPAVFRAVTGSRMSGILGFLNYELFLGGRLTGNGGFRKSCGIDLRECLDHPAALDTPRKIFERRIRYWECRPMPDDPLAVVSPADSQVLLGSFSECSGLCVKGKFFDYEELLGPEQVRWLDAFRDGDFAVCRLTPDKYHYNHTPVAGVVVDLYEIDGAYHSCNPGAVIALVTPYSKNKRVVTVIDTDVPGGTQAGLVAMIEVVALMIGGIAQCYSESAVPQPRPRPAGHVPAQGPAQEPLPAGKQHRHRPVPARPGRVLGGSASATAGAVRPRAASRGPSALPWRRRT